jgi:hypothetical protein
MMLRQHAFRQKNIRRDARPSRGKKQNDNTMLREGRMQRCLTIKKAKLKI